VTNAAKHSRARSIAIRLLGTADRLEITVEDDGQGLPLGPARPAQGMGLQISCNTGPSLLAPASSSAPARMAARWFPVAFRATRR
jgi:nitrate/nitrite-specific signal transduction histidine kinase